MVVEFFPLLFTHARISLKTCQKLTLWHTHSHPYNNTLAQPTHSRTHIHTQRHQKHVHTHTFQSFFLPYLSLFLCILSLNLFPSLSLSLSHLNPALAPSSFSPWGKHNLDSLILSLWEETSLRLKNFLPQISFLKKQLGSNNDQIEIPARNFGKNWFRANLQAIQQNLETRRRSNTEKLP